MEHKAKRAIRRVTPEEIPLATIRTVWVNCLRGDEEAIKAKDAWHKKYPELDNKFAEFCLTIERIRNPKKSKKKKVHTDVAKTTSTWTKAKDKFMSSSKGSGWPVNGGLPSLGKRK